MTRKPAPSALGPFPLIRRAGLLLTALGVLCCAALPAGAQDLKFDPMRSSRLQQDDAYRDTRQGRIVPLDRVIEQIRRRTPGRLLNAGLEEGRDGRQIYRVRWATDDGRRIDYIVDAQSGQILGTDD
ncbi:MAG: PepSY domain-containing protein [Asticcacaulis sp.]